jgi:hypothetical protein
MYLLGMLLITSVLCATIYQMASPYFTDERLKDWEREQRRK